MIALFKIFIKYYVKNYYKKFFILWLVTVVSIMKIDRYALGNWGTYNYLFSFTRPTTLESRKAMYANFPFEWIETREDFDIDLETYDNFLILLTLSVCIGVLIMWNSVIWYRKWTYGDEIDPLEPEPTFFFEGDTYKFQTPDLEETGWVGGIAFEIAQMILFITSQLGHAAALFGEWDNNGINLIDREWEKDRAARARFDKFWLWITSFFKE